MNKLDGDIGRTDPFSAITDGRPPKTVDGALNILLVGSDSRDPDAPLDEGSKWRADTIIVMHIPASHDKAYLVSLPRDLYVPIPESASAGCENADRGKINAAFAFGGLPLAVRTVECFTDLRIDHVMAIDFARLQGGHRRAGRCRPARGADDHLDPQAVPDVQEGHATT